MDVELLTPIIGAELIAAGTAIRDIARLRKWYGRGRWRKLKGQAVVRLPDTTEWRAEVHWYEANGIRRREIKVKVLLEQVG